MPALVAGGLALCALGRGVPFGQLGLGTSRLPLRLVGGVVLGGLLLLPAFARGVPAAVLPGSLVLPAAIVAAGEEIAFRGALYAALESSFGPAAAVVGSAALFTAAHVLSHPPAFLLPVAALGLLLGLWRWACRDLVAPITAHVLADVLL